MGPAGHRHESHLAVRVHLNYAGFAVYKGILDEERKDLLPSDDPELPPTIADVWLALSFTYGDVLHWRRGTGWTRHPASPRAS